MNKPAILDFDSLITAASAISGMRVSASTGLPTTRMSADSSPVFSFCKAMG